MTFFVFSILQKISTGYSFFKFWFPSKIWTKNVKSITDIQLLFTVKSHLLTKIDLERIILTYSHRFEPIDFFLIAFFFQIFFEFGFAFPFFCRHTSILFCLPLFFVLLLQTNSKSLGLHQNEYPKTPLIMQML